MHKTSIEMLFIGDNLEILSCIQIKAKQRLGVGKP